MYACMYATLYIHTYIYIYTYVSEQPHHGEPGGGLHSRGTRRAAQRRGPRAAESAHRLRGLRG